MDWIVKGNWPIIVFALMFLVLPFATLPGMFDFIFVILGGFTFIILGLIVASLILSRTSAAAAAPERSAPADGHAGIEGNGK